VVLQLGRTEFGRTQLGRNVLGRMGLRGIDRALVALLLLSGVFVLHHGGPRLSSFS
jgi:hypothetical protein